jgi:hypothetical protein
VSRIMTLVTCVVLAVVVTVLASPAQALGLFAQWQDSNDAGSAYGLGAKHAFLKLLPIVDLEGRVSWLHYDSDEMPSSFEALPLEAVGTVSLGVFYGGLGVGYYLFSGDVAPDDSVGGFVAGGASFGLLGVRAFAELRYLLLEPDGADMSGVGIHVGASLGF